MEETVKEYQRLLADQIATHQQELDELSRQLQQSASIDDLTGLFTARVFREVLLREIQRARRACRHAKGLGKNQVTAYAETLG